MIVNCPTCATRHALPDHLAQGTVTITCQSCGHRWQERETIDLIDVPSRNLPRVIEHDRDDMNPEAESRRLAQMARETREAYLAQQSLRKTARRRWQAYTVFLLAPFVALALFPEQVVSAAPVTLKAYQRLGYDINVYGLDIRRVERQHAIVNGTRVLSVRGEILNLSDDTRRIPWLRFALVDGADRELYTWTLDTSSRPLRAGEANAFTTRVAAPPEGAQNLKIRFAKAEEIGSKTP
jgi:zinc-ribbon domain